MKKTITASLTLAALSLSGSAALYTNFQFDDAVQTALGNTSNAGTDTTAWNFNVNGNPGESATDGAGTLFIGANATAGSANITKDYTRKVTFGSSVTASTVSDFVLEYRLASWDFGTAIGDANGANQEGITFKLTGTGGTINLISAVNSGDTNVRARHALDGLTGTAAQNNIGSSGTDLVVRVEGNLATGAFTTSINEGGAGFSTIIADGGGLTSLDEIVLTIEGTQAWSGDSVGVDYLTLDVTAVPEPSSTALLGLGGLALILRRRK